MEGLPPTTWHQQIKSKIQGPRRHSRFFWKLFRFLIDFSEGYLLHSWRVWCLLVQQASVTGCIILTTVDVEAGMRKRMHRGCDDVYLFYSNPKNRYRDVKLKSTACVKKGLTLTWTLIGLLVSASLQVLPVLIQIGFISFCCWCNQMGLSFKSFQVSNKTFLNVTFW